MGARLKHRVGVAGAIIGAFFLFFSTAGAAAQDAPVWQVDTERSRITFVGRQMGSPSEGEFRQFSGTVRFSPERLDASEIRLTVDVASAHTGNSDIDTALRDEKWFDAEGHPEARFVASSFRETGENQYEATGSLTIKGVTREQNVAFEIAPVNGASEGLPDAARATGELTISRLAYNVGDDEWRDTSIVADEVVIRFEIVATRSE